VIPSSYKEAPSDIVVQDTKEGAKGDKKRRKQCPQWVADIANYDSGNDEKAGGSIMGHVMTTTCSGKRQLWLPTNHFEKLLEEANPNHVYPVKQKLGDCDMMKNFMMSSSLTQGMELNDAPEKATRCSSLGRPQSWPSTVGAPRQGGAMCLT
jgi:hypothetical protein